MLVAHEPFALAGKKHEMLQSNVRQSKPNDFVVEIGARIVAASDGYARRLGYGVDALLETDITRVIAPHERERLTDYGRSRAQNGSAPRSYSFDALHQNGSAVRFFVTVATERRKSDVAIVTRLRSADEFSTIVTEQDFERFYDAHADSTYALLLMLLRNRDAAADVLQETFINAWQKRASYDPQRGDQRSWALAMGRSRALDFLRKQRRRAGKELPIHEPGVFGQSEVAVGTDRLVAEAALDALPAAQRELITLSFIGGMSHSEIARARALPLGTVKTRIASGLRALRKALS